MIHLSKDYNENSLGGYLLNDVEYNEDVFALKNNYNNSSMISNDNKLFYLLNNTVKTPFKVNKDLLSYLMSDKGRDLLINESDFKAYENVDDLSKYKQEKLKSLHSKFFTRNDTEYYKFI